MLLEEFTVQNIPTRSPSLKASATPVRAFSLVEILLVVAVIGIISGLAMTYMGGTSEHTRSLVARQQQVQLQTALDAWITATASGPAGLAAAKAAYSTDAGAMLTNNLAPYLREPGIFRIEGGGVSSGALAGIGKTLQFSSWSEGSYPKVLMQ